MNSKSLTGKHIAIIGGTGTLGKALVEQLMLLKVPMAVLIVSRDEMKQLEMMEEYRKTGLLKIEFKLGDVRDPDRMVELLKGIDVVIHSAALKHVVMAERNPEECYKTNVVGTGNIINACKQNSVAKAILISTDKAENPIGIYGRSKLKAEELFRNENEAPTHFQIVRLGNIIGSRGSVTRAFERQKETGTLKISQPDSTRFFISKEEAAIFILSLISKEGGVRIAIPEMRSLRILDLAKFLHPTCKVEFTGLRPGDKLHEEVGGVSSSKSLKEGLQEHLKWLNTLKRKE